MEEGIVVGDVRVARRMVRREIRQHRCEQLCGSLGHGVARARCIILYDRNASFSAPGSLSIGIYIGDCLHL